jgi:hypothetical protein
MDLILTGVIVGVIGTLAMDLLNHLFCPYRGTSENRRRDDRENVSGLGTRAILL